MWSFIGLGLRWRCQIVPDTLTLQESDVMGYVDEHGRVTTADVERLLSVKARRAREVLKEMTEKGLLEKGGSARSTFYVRADA